MFERIQPEDMVLKIDIEIEWVTGIYKASTSSFVRFGIYPKTCDFYQFIPQNPQWNDGLCDDCFEW